MKPRFRFSPEALAKMKNAIKAFGSRQALSDKTGIPLITIEKTLKGETSPSFGIVAQICAVTGLSLDDLAFGDDTRVKELSSAFIAFAGAIAKLKLPDSEQRRLEGHRQIVERHLRVMAGRGDAPRDVAEKGRVQPTTAGIFYSEGDWHPERIKSAVRAKGRSMRKLAIANGLTVQALTHALHRPLFGPETVIAEFLELPPHVIWPSRYRPDGSRRSVTKTPRPA